MNTAPTLESNRLILRTLVSTDAEDLKEWFGLDEVYKYWGRPPGKLEKNPILLFKESKPYIKKAEKDFVWAIVSRNSNKLIGIIELYDISADRSAKVGYRINPAVWNQGYCTEALKAVTDFAVRDNKIERIYAKIDIRNTASNRVASKCGFIFEGSRNGRFGLINCDYNCWVYVKYPDFTTSNLLGIPASAYREP